MHGPGSHLGSNGTDNSARVILAPQAECIDKLDSLERFKVILRLLGKPPLLEGEQPWQDMAVLVKLRNEITHFKSKWGQEMERQKLYRALQGFKLPKPPFVLPGSNFFPHHCLSARARCMVRPDDCGVPGRILRANGDRKPS